MKIIFASMDGHDAWIDQLQTALPNVEIVPWRAEGPASDAEAAVVWNPPPELCLRETNLKAIFNLGAGVDAVLALPGLGDIPVYRLEDAGMAVQMAEYVLHALLRVSRNFDQYAAFQQQAEWKPLPDINREEWPVAILGMGVMGSRVAQAVAALEYPVSGWARGPKDVPGVETFAGSDELPALLRRTRVLVNTLPLTPETRHILCRKNMELLQPGAYIINVGRGEHLVEDDLLALLDEGHVAGATLDVFVQEPLPDGHPFWHRPQITITPHVAAASLIDNTVSQVAGKLTAFKQGRPVSGLVMQDRGY